jgi:alkylation response protein AidB-like acyl-CoA dehydrogenase
VLTISLDFNRERLVIAIGMNKAARICLADALQYAHDRKTFGQPLIANQVIRAKFATIARYIESHWAWVEQLAYHIKVTGHGEDLVGHSESYESQMRMLISATGGPTRAC